MNSIAAGGNILFLTLSFRYEVDSPFSREFDVKHYLHIFQPIAIIVLYVCCLLPCTLLGLPAET